MERVALYVRVSTEEQRLHGISVDAQLKALTDYSAANGYEIAGIYIDAGISARKSYKKRPALLRLITDCQIGKIDLILICKLDRFFRSVPDYYAVMEQIGNVPWKAIHEDYETVTSAGVFKVNIMLSVAQSEADRTSERVRRTNEYKLSKGEYVGGTKAPLGYKRDGKHYVINEDECEGVKAFFNAYLSTLSRYNALEAAKHAGLDMSIYQADRLLNHPAYYGGLNYSIGTYITKEEHEIIEAAKKSTRVFYTNERRNIFSGLLVCKECGNKMIVSRQIHKRKDGGTTEVTRYICKKHQKRAGCSGSSINEAFLEGYLIDKLRCELDNYNYSVSSSDSTLDTNKIKNLNARLKRLRDLYELGDIDFTEYKNKRLPLTRELESLQKVEVSKVKELPDNWVEVYNTLDKEHKRAFWYSYLTRIEVGGMRCQNPIIIF